MSTGQEPNAHVGDWIETRGVHGKPSRRGEIIELLGSGDHEHYRVRGMSGTSRLFIPPTE